MQGQHRFDKAPLALASLWALHYGHRVLVYPLRVRPGNKTMPAAIALMAVVFNLLNASVNAPQLSMFGRYDDAWLVDPRFSIGAAIFVAGFVVNVRADEVLLRLRPPGDTTYRIPHGALHDRVASPNYLGEVIEWTGFAIATWSLAGLAFALYTAANLVPRALTHRAWYRSKFPDYPPERRAIFPWIL
jgi:steroid 5-alpha reductase family enzyme